MGIRVMRLVTLWLVVSTQSFRAHGFAINSAKGVQGGHKRGRDSTEVAQGDVKDVCRVGDSPATCQDLSAKYRGGAGAAATIGADTSHNLSAIKFLLQICLTTLNVVCWLVPMKIRRFVESPRAISIANAFSGGVFLSLAFAHLLPHARHGFEGTGLPENMPYLLTLSGYMLIFFVEKVAFDAHNIMHEVEESSTALQAPNDEKSGAVVAPSAGGPSGRSAKILLAALGVHALMETMALGLSSSRVNAGLLAMSIGLHQPAESLALLVSFLKSGLSEKQIITMLSIFSCIGPVGSLIGIALSEVAGQLADAIMVAVAAGTFVYVGATEVIPEEFETPPDKWKKFFALTGGMGIIIVVTRWAEALEDRAL